MVDSSTICLLGVGFVNSKLRVALEQSASASHNFIEITRKNFHETPKVLQQSNIIISSIPPENGADALLENYRSAIENSPARRIIYLSSTGVYAESNGGWVDETAPTNNSVRAKVEQQWHNLNIPLTVLRLGGIYGYQRGLIHQVKNNQVARRVDAPAAVMNRIHINDIIQTMTQFIKKDIPNGIYNIVDDCPATSRVLIEAACRRLNKPMPPLQTLTVAKQSADFSPMAARFYANTKRVDNRKVKRATGLLWQYPSYKTVLCAL